MANSSSGTSSGSTALLPNSAAEEDMIRKQKRMRSNRESARRSRLRKQKHLDELTAQVQQLQEENRQFLASLSLATQRCFAIEAENSVLQTQMAELSSRLQSLNEILLCLGGSVPYYYSSSSSNGSFLCDGAFSNPWSFVCMNQPIIAAADMFEC